MVLPEPRCKSLGPRHFGRVRRSDLFPYCLLREISRGIDVTPPYLISSSDKIRLSVQSSVDVILSGT